MNRLVVVCGEPGVGKSKVADHIADRTGATVLRTDEIRKELFGPEPDYSRQESQAVYDEMFDRARTALEDDESVVLDATFMYGHGRRRARRLAQAETDPYNFTLVRVECDRSVARRRIRERLEEEDSTSDADVDVYESIRQRFEPVEMDDAVFIDNSDWWFSTKRRMREAELYESPPYYS